MSKNLQALAAPEGGPELSTKHSMFGPPPLVAGEDPAAYEELHSRISAAVKPKDFLEEIWVRDVVDLTWDSLRMRRLKASLLTSVRGQGLEALVRPVLGWTDAEELSKQWTARDRGAVKQVDKQLAAMGVNMDAPMAHALALRIDQFERIERMIMNAEARRNAALREVDRHRSSLAQALRQASDDVIEADFEDVPSQQRAQEDAA
jgi:hypothetical protein